MKITILGGGKWGTALTTIYANKFKNESICYWIRPESKTGVKPRYEYVQESRINPFDNFPSVILPENVEVTSDIKYAVNDSDIVINTIPSKHLEFYLNAIKDESFKYFVNASKGVINDKPISFTYGKIIKHTPYAVLSGPNIAKDIISNFSKNNELISPAAATLACKNSHDRIYLSQTLDYKPYYRVFPNKDVKSVEYCGILKQVYAMVIGFCIGLGYDVNTISSLFQDCSFEVRRILKKQGLNPNVFYETKAGLPDLEVTYKSGRNGKLGYYAAIDGLEKSLEKFKNECVEGLRILQALHLFSEEKKISLPILEACYSIVYLKQDPKDIIDKLMNFDLKRC